MKDFKTTKVLTFEKLLSEILQNKNKIIAKELCILYNKCVGGNYNILTIKDENTFELTHYNKLKKEDNPNIHIGGYYELPTKKVVYIFRCNNVKREIHYKFENSKNYIATFEEVKKWKHLNINDFPNAKNPKVPYSFDLFFDIKRESDLKAAMQGKWYLNGLSYTDLIKTLKEYPNLYTRFKKYIFKENLE